MKKFVFAAVATVALTGFVIAEDLTVTISKVDAKAGTITYAKFAFKKKDDAGDAKAPEPVTAKISKDCKIAKGEFDTDAAGGKGGGKGKGGFGGGGAFKAGDVLEKGLENDAFKISDDKKGVFARVTVADEDKGSVKKGDVTQILVINFGAGFGKGGKKGGGDQ